MSYYFNALIKGIIEGVTEFLPISSTGHLILAREMLPLTGDAVHAQDLDKIFDVIIQLPAIVAVLLLYRARLWQSVGAMRTEQRARTFWIGLCVAFLPAAVVGLLAGKYIETYLMKPTPVAIALIVGGVILILADRFGPEGKFEPAEAVPIPNAFFIGVFQCFGMFPGTSRSAATIIGGRLMNLTRNAAAEYSFFLAIPTMCGAFAYKMITGWKLIRPGDAPILAIGCVVSFVVALLVVKGLMVYLRKHSLEVFGYYRILLGVGTLVYVWWK